ncbi:hypothetical protein FKP32DRAFT_1594488 [Trametes sanguinea]|nr:hypothetical protein FKP32DRAFT_1594488 [Trametes sanguinea]
MLPNAVASIREGAPPTVSPTVRGSMYVLRKFTGPDASCIHVRVPYVATINAVDYSPFQLSSTLHSGRLPGRRQARRTTARPRIVRALVGTLHDGHTIPAFDFRASRAFLFCSPLFFPVCTSGQPRRGAQACRRRRRRVDGGGLERLSLRSRRFVAKPCKRPRQSSSSSCPGLDRGRGRALASLVGCAGHSFCCERASRRRGLPLVRSRRFYAVVGHRRRTGRRVHPRADNKL